LNPAIHYRDNKRKGGGVALSPRAAPPPRRWPPQTSYERCAEMFGGLLRLSRFHGVTPSEPTAAAAASMAFTEFSRQLLVGCHFLDNRGPQLAIPVCSCFCALNQTNACSDEPSKGEPHEHQDKTPTRAHVHIERRAFVRLHS
jgi:hypothetical protein